MFSNMPCGGRCFCCGRRSDKREGSQLGERTTLRSTTALAFGGSSVLEQLIGANAMPLQTAADMSTTLGRMDEVVR